MSTPFSPQLIGETEKTLNALLRRSLEDTGLTEPLWVTLRLAGQLEGTVDAAGLADHAGGVQQPFRKSCLTGVYMRQDSQVERSAKQAS